MKINTRVRAYALATVIAFAASVLTAHGYVYPQWIYRYAAGLFLTFGFAGIVATMALISHDGRRW